MSYRLIDANALIGEISYEDYEKAQNAPCIYADLPNEMDDGMYLAIPSHEGMTNGDMIKAVFPNARVGEIFPTIGNDEVYYVPIEKVGGVNNEMRVMKSWWNAPYKEGE